jgi:SAM-dependent methyltransferase
VIDPSIEDRVARYYGEKVQAHGAEPRGVDWNSAESQQLRFVQLLEVAKDSGPFSLTDYGCGYGALLDALAGEDRLTLYQGFDIAEPMVELALCRFAGRNDCEFTTRPQDLRPTDFVVASGIFNARLDIRRDAWRDYVIGQLERMVELARVGFAFNMLTSYSDAERQRPDLYYADPMWWFDHCKRNLAPRVRLLHDYPLWEFTIVAWK